MFILTQISLPLKVGTSQTSLLMNEEGCFKKGKVKGPQKPPKKHSLPYVTPIDAFVCSSAASHDLW